MDPFEQKLRDALQSGPRVAFSNQLHDQILRKAKQQSRIKRTLRMAIGGASILAAAAVTILLIPNNDSPLADLPQSQGISKEHAVLNENVKKPVYSAKSVWQENLSWTVAPIDIEQIRTDGRAVFATIKNSGSTPLTNNEIQGILYFPPEQGTMKGRDTWFYFVDGPNQPVKPGANAEWGFHPTAVPSETGRIDRTPRLLFVYRNHQTNSPASNVTWVPLSISHQIKAVYATGEQQQYLDIKLQVTNLNQASIDLKQTMAMVFFPKNETDDNMDPFTYKYFVDLTTEAENRLLPGKSADVHMQLIGPPGVNLTKRTIRVQFVSKQMSVQPAK